jgi:RimJ/RimL family protein N-acetyltransferase
MFILGVDSRYEAFIFAPAHNASTYVAHLAIRKDHRDGTIPRRVAEAGKWIFQNTTCKAIMAFIREENIPIKTVLSRIGMKQIGRTSKTLLMGGILHDELIYQCTVDDYNRIWGKELGEV